MLLTLFTFAVPAALFLVLALLPRGRTAFLSALAVAALLVCLWLAHFLDVLGLRARGDDTAQLYAFFGLLSLTLAWFMGTSLQVLRRRFPPHWPAWSWPTVVFVTLLVVGFGIYRMLSL